MDRTLTMVAAAIGIGTAVAGVAGGVISSSAAGSAASKQAAAANNALAAQTTTTNYNNAMQAPFIQAGQSALDTQQDQINSFQPQLQQYQAVLNNSVPQAMTEANLVNTPGYKFDLSQGLEATQNAAAARGLGVSGAALKGASSYATGLADKTYQNQFAIQQTQYQDAANNLQSALAINNQGFNQNASRIQVGENAATGSGTQGQAGAANTGKIDTGLGNALGGSAIAQGNALSGGINSAVNSYNQQSAIAAYQNGGGSYGNQNTQASNDAQTKANGDAPFYSY